MSPETPPPKPRTVEASVRKDYQNVNPHLLDALIHFIKLRDSFSKAADAIDGPQETIGKMTAEDLQTQTSKRPVAEAANETAEAPEPPEIEAEANPFADDQELQEIIAAIQMNFPYLDGYFGRCQRTNQRFFNLVRSYQYYGTNDPEITDPFEKAEAFLRQFLPKSQSQQF